MGKIVKSKLACIDATCGSSDARALYEDGTSFCFSCRNWFSMDEAEAAGLDETAGLPGPLPVRESKVVAVVEEVDDLIIRGIPERGISKEVCEFYGVKCSFGSDGKVSAHYYPYDNGQAYKIRTLPKNFTWTGKSSNLFGQTLFGGGGRKIVITEGEIDALSIAQSNWEKYKKVYPTVALSSAAMMKSLLENRDWLRSYDEVILCLDNDEAGKKAEASAIKIIGIDKVRLIKYPADCKDANDVLMKHGWLTLQAMIFEAGPFIPSGIITKEALWESLVAYRKTPSVPYPDCLEGINKKTKGARLGEIALFVSGTSCGKSTVMREICLSMRGLTDSKIGIVSLEEAPAETAIKLAGMVLNRNPAKDEIPLDEIKVGFDQVFGTDGYMLLDHQGSLKDESILSKIEYMALMGCNYIIIDHITILASEGTEGLTGNEAIDKIMNDLLRFVKRHNVWVGLVSHLRKTNVTAGKAFEEGRMPNLDDIKGSGSIKQVSFDIIAFARDLMAEDPIARNTINIAVLKCRYTGLTGPAQSAYYNYDTGRFMAHADDFVAIV